MTGTTITNVTGLLTATNPKIPRHTKPVCKTITQISYSKYMYDANKAGGGGGGGRYSETQRKVTIEEGHAFLKIPENISGRTNYFTCTMFITRN